MQMSITLKERIDNLQKLIRETASSCHRSPNEILLLAVAKGQSAKAIEEAFFAGIHHIGENYLQEAQEKMQQLAPLPLCWHFIGSIQKNKAEAIAKHFSWVHSISREKIAELLDLHRPSDLPPLNVCLQVNLDEEETKSGLNPAQVAPLAFALSQRPNLKLRGLMAIPKPHQGEEEQLNSFLRLRRLLNEVNQELGLTMDTLSMGMSDDWAPAIRAGSTILRVGRAIFGERK